MDLNLKWAKLSIKMKHKMLIMLFWSRLCRRDKYGVVKSWSRGGRSFNDNEAIAQGRHCDAEPSQRNGCNPTRTKSDKPNVGFCVS